MIIGALSGCTASAERAPDLPPIEIGHVGAAAAAKLLADDPGVVVLDLRTAWEYDAGHIAGAKRIDYYSLDFRDRLAMLDRNARYLIHCKSGVRSAATIEIMDELGFRHVDHLDGGFDSWRAAGLPIEKG